MKKISIFTTIGGGNLSPSERQDLYLEALESYLDFADEVVLVIGDDENNREWIKNLPKDDKLKFIYKYWASEFDWKRIGKQFQFGYENCTGNYVIRADGDYFFHQDDFEDIRTFLEGCDAPAALMAKKQILRVDKFRVKSLVPIALNKGKYGDRIKLDKGGDLCQPSLDGKELDGDKLPIISRKEPVVISGEVDERQLEKRLPSNIRHYEGDMLYTMNRGIHFWNYECILRTKDVQAKEFHRFAKAWQRTFGDDPLGAESEIKALERFLEMQLGRFRRGGWTDLELNEHPKYIQETIKNLKPEQFGYSLWGNVEKAKYFR